MTTSNFTIIVEGILLFSVGCFGLFGNFFSIVMFSQKKFQKNFHLLMSCLAVYDLLYISLAIALFSLPQLIPNIRQDQIFLSSLPYLLPMAHISLTGSVYFTLAVTIERYTTVCHPFFKFSHKMSVWKCYIFPISLFSLFYNIPKFMELRTTWSADSMVCSSNETMCGNETIIVTNTTTDSVEPEPTFLSIEATDLRVNPNYVKYYLIYLNFVVNSLIPFVLLIILNGFIYRTLSKINLPRHQQQEHITQSPGGFVHRREMILAHISLAIVVVFILSHSVKWIPNIWELRQAEMDNLDVDFPPVINCIAEVSHLMTVFNSSSNFYIYLVKHHCSRVTSAAAPNNDTIVDGVFSRQVKRKVVIVSANKQISFTTEVTDAGQI